jgi:hypothetical protein
LKKAIITSRSNNHPLFTAVPPVAPATLTTPLEPMRKRKPINRHLPTRDRGVVVNSRRNNAIIVVFIIGLVCLVYGGYLLSYQVSFTLPAYSLFLVIGIMLISVAFYLKGSG